MFRRGLSVVLAGLLLCFVLTGCGVSEEMLAEITAGYEARIARLEASMAELEEKADAPVEDEESAREKEWIVVTDYIETDGHNDVSSALQKLINDNPRRTLYFPDGVYMLDQPISTPADPAISVDLQLSNYAIIRAGKKWSSGGAMIRLGGIAPKNDIATPGSVYSLTGGIIDCGGRADGISIESGRETAIRNVSIKNSVIGIHIFRGTNSNSSDSDIYNVNIVGAGTDESIGVLIEGYDNTLTNMRIANVQCGVKLQSSGNMLRNIHPLYYDGSTTYTYSYGFYDAGGNNWYDYCYSDQFRTGFYVKGNLSNVYDNCFCFWYSGNGDAQIAMRTGGKFNSLVTSIRVGFHADAKKTVLLEPGAEGGEGVIEYALVDTDRLTGKAHEPYIIGKLIDS